MYVVTLKPKSINEMLVKEIQNLGIQHFRVNFARNSFTENTDLIHLLKQSGSIVFVDLPGEKLRLNYVTDVRVMKEGEIFTLKQSSHVICNHNSATITNETFFKIVSCGDVLTIGDSNAQFVVDKIKNNEIVIYCTVAGKMYNKAGVSIKDKYIEKKHLCKSDINIVKNLDYSLIDYICVSFADRSEIIKETRKYLPNDSNVKVIAKIESPIGVNNLRDILTESDGILLARSDLSKFYTIDQLSNLAEEFKAQITDDKILIFASNYLRKSIQSGITNEQEINYLRHDYNLNPDYIYINETYYSKDIINVINQYVNVTSS